jgi:hypothetical protein
MIRTLHALAAGLWFGAVVFFTIAGVLIFQAFADASAPTFDQRAIWFPEPEEFGHPPLGEGFPDPTRLEQGSRAAGAAVGRIFPVYFPLQAGCAAVALLTALGLGGPRRVRLAFCLLGLLVVLGGWWLEERVAALRVPRNDLTDVVLRTPIPSEEQLEAAREARATFGRWHFYSLAANFAALAVAAVVCGLAPHTGPGPKT